MKTNRILYIAAAVLALGTFSACDKFLDVNPDNRAEANTEKNILKLLTAAYPTTDISYVLEVMSDNVEHRPSAANSNRFIKQVFDWEDVSESDDCSPEEIWNGFYNGIAHSNTALDGIEKLAAKSGWTESLRQAKAEALLIRAYNHFILVNIFAKHYNKATAEDDLGITYMKDSESTLIAEYERNTVAEVYQHIDEDLQEARPLVGDSNYDVAKYHFNKKAAYAFASKFYLFYEDLDKAIEYADFVLGKNPSDVLFDFANIKTGANGDFYVITERYTGVESKANLLLISKNSEWGAMCGPFTYMHEYCHTYYNARTETRIYSGNQPWGASQFLMQVGTYTSWKSCFWYVPYEFEYTDPVNGIGYAHFVQPAVTTHDALFARAEAKIRKGAEYYDEAIADLNAWVHAFSSTTTTMTLASIKSYFNGMAYSTWNAGTPKKQLHPSFAIDADGSDQEVLLQCLLHLHRLDKLHWGDRWFDVKRFGIELYRRELNTGATAATQNTDDLTVDDPRRAVQIPAKVIAAGYTPNPR